MNYSVIDFKSIVDFFCTFQPTSENLKKQRHVAEKLICKYNSRNPKKHDIYTCKINELTNEWFKNWQSLKYLAKERFLGTVYEEIFIERFEQKNSYLYTSMGTHQSSSNYYIKLNYIYTYIFALAAQKGLITV